MHAVREMGLISCCQEAPTGDAGFPQRKPGGVVRDALEFAIRDAGGRLRSVSSEYTADAASLRAMGGLRRLTRATNWRGV